MKWSKEDMIYSYMALFGVGAVFCLVVNWNEYKENYKREKICITKLF